jgi:hypothetical protein
MSQYELTEYDSGCATIDIPRKHDIIVIQAEPQIIGVSLIDINTLLDFSSPDRSFANITDTINYIESL